MRATHTAVGMPGVPRSARAHARGRDYGAYRAAATLLRTGGRSGVSALEAVVAWAALAGWIAAGVLLVLAHRRLDALERAHTARKWDIIGLRAELGALRRRLREAGVAEPGPSEPEPSEPGTRTVLPTTGPTAWRRAHRRPGVPRRRRPS